MKRGTWRTRWAVGLALIGLVWLLIWSNTGRSLVQAERLVATAGLLRSDLTEAGYNFFPYHAVAFGWMDGAHLRVVARDTNRAAYHAEVDLEAGTITRGRGFPGLPDAEGGWERTFDWRPSPDGKWMLYLQAAGKEVIYAACSLTSDRQYRWTNVYGGLLAPAWLSDSTGFVDWPTRGSGWVLRRFRLGETQGRDWDLAALPLKRVPPGASAPGVFAAAPQAVISTLGTQPWDTQGTGRQPGAVLIVLPPENPDAPERWVVPLPEPLEKAYTRAEISPVGDRVAWLADHPATLPKLTLLRGWPFVVTESRRRATIWLSALDGSGLRFLGRLPPQAGVNALEWDPSGASISFLHQEAIWRVPLAREVRVKRN